jgi:hypothetical protein
LPGLGRACPNRVRRGRGFREFLPAMHPSWRTGWRGQRPLNSRQLWQGPRQNLARNLGPAAQGLQFRREQQRRGEAD